MNYQYVALGTALAVSLFSFGAAVGTAYERKDRKYVEKSFPSNKATELKTIPESDNVRTTAP